MRAVVTLRFPRQPNHDPRDKKTGICPLSRYCTDVTGEHHSYIEEAQTLELISIAAEEMAKIHNGRITRIEVI